MKQLILYAALGVTCAVGFGSTTAPTNDNIEQQVPVVHDTLVGRFNGIDIDTIIAEPYGKPSVSNDPEDIYSGFYLHWRIYSKQGTVKDLHLDDFTTGVHFVAEGDLDGNGTEEWSFVNEWPTSNWCGMRTYTYVNGRWLPLIEDTAIWYPHIDPYETELCVATPEQIVEPSPIKGVVNVRTSCVTNDGLDFLLICKQSKILNAAPSRR